MIHILCFEPHIKVVASIENLNVDILLKNKINYASSIDLKLAGDGIDAAIILAKMRIPSLMIALVANSDRHTITEKIQEQNINLIEVLSERNSQIDIEILSNKKTNYILSPYPPHTQEADKLLSIIEGLTKYDVLIIPGESNPQLMLKICQTCSDGMINFYFDYKDSYNSKILNTNPFLVSFTMEQISKLTNKKATESNIFALIEELSQRNLENIIVISNNTLFLKMKTHMFSIFSEGFSELNKIINKEMLIASFIGLMSTTPNPKKAINEAISVVRDHAFNISSTFLYSRSQKINDIFKQFDEEEDEDVSKFFMDLNVYWNTKELLFIISKKLVDKKSSKKIIIQKITDYFKTSNIRERVNSDNYYFHIKLYENSFPINENFKLEKIANDHREPFIKIIKKILNF